MLIQTPQAPWAGGLTGEQFADKLCWNLGKRQGLRRASVECHCDKVRLGIEAPQSIPVHRQEVYDAIQRENRRASQTGSGATKDIKPPTAD